MYFQYSSDRFNKFGNIFLSHISATSSSQKTPRKKWTEKEILSLHTGYELYEALVSTADPVSLEVSVLVDFSVSLEENVIITTRKRSLVQGHVFKGACLSTGGGVCPSMHHRSLSGGISVRDATYWNAFLLSGVDQSFLA